MQVLILGLGNALMRDDGFGVQAIAALTSRFRFPAEIRLIDGGTLGLDLLPHLENVDKLVIVDALDMREPPGRVFRLEGDSVPRAFASKLSVHQMGIQDLLAVAELQGHLPGTLVVWGVQPESIEMGTELTPAVAAALPAVLDGIAGELQSWNCPCVTI